MGISFYIYAFTLYKNFSKAAEAVKAIRQLLANVGDGQTMSKVVYRDGKFNWSLTGPQWPSKNHFQYLRDELHRVKPLPGNRRGLRVLYLAITNKCNLNCEHCFEWERLNESKEFNLPKLLNAVKSFQKSHGIAQIQLTGGEPFLKYDRLLQSVKELARESNVWVISSGVGVSLSRLKELKLAGLTGIHLSLDSYDEKSHDEFRGTPGAFKAVENATRLANMSGLVIAYSLCLSRKMSGRQALEKYAQLAQDRGVDFINIIEPKPVGRYKGNDEVLNCFDKAEVESFYLDMNNDPKYRSFPIVAYPDHQVRKLGCQGGGNRLLYINSSGGIYDCPFCPNDYQVESDSSIVDFMERTHTPGCIPSMTDARVTVRDDLEVVV